jgi:diguanylate cyclase (GGDEF)-like protein
MSSKSSELNPSLNVEQDATPETRPERRAHRRQALDRVGRLSRDGKSYCDCRVRDFCPDGMLLAVDDRSADEPVIGGEVVTVGESLVLEFTVRLNGEKHEHLARVRVVRTSSKVIGVSFDGENAEAVWQLRQLVGQLEDGLRKNRDKARSARSPCAPMAVEQALNAGQMLDVAKEQTELFLTEGLGKLFEEAEKRLVASTNYGVGDTNNVNPLEAMKEIQNVKISIEAAYLKAVTRDFDRMINPDAVKEPGESTGEQELALVDTGSFDDWLTIKNIISAEEDDLKEAQYELEQGFTHLTRTTIDEENNPIGLAPLCLTFHDAVQGLGASGYARRTILEVFEHAIAKRLGEFYADVNTIFANSGILPSVQRGKHVIKSSESKRKAADVKATGEESASTLGEESASTLGEESASTLGEDNPDSSAVSADSVSRTPTMLPPLRLGTAFQAAGNLIAMQRDAEAGGTPNSGEFVQGLSNWTSAQPTLEQQKELLDSLSILQRSTRFTQPSGDGPLQLNQKLTATWRSAGLEASPDHHMMLDIVSNLIDAIMDDPFVSDEVKLRVRRLAVPILKVAFQDPSFFEDQMHPARQVLDNLGRLDPESTEGFAGIVDPVVNGIIENYEDDPAIFARALSSLKVVVSKQRKTFQENLERLVSEREKQQEFIKARQKDSGQAGAPAPAPAPAQSAAAGSNDEWEGWLNEARGCKPGDVLSIEEQQDRRKKLSLAWVSEDKGTFVLVDSLGNKAMSLTAQELAMHMKRGSAVAEDIANMALTDRGTYRMLRSLHEQLARKASHDQLTGLLTRKEFEGRLDELITDAVRSASCHVMYAFDVEGLQNITKKAGKTVGAQLLKKLAKLLEKQVASRGAVARLGTSRFGVLLNNASLDEGKETAERQREVIAKARCMWKGESFPLTASAGMLEITDMSEGVVAILTAVESALARAAKKGGDRIEMTGTVHDPLKAQGLHNAGKTTVLDMLNLDSLKLRCQRVIPLTDDGAALAHYEVLLGVQREEGLVALPADFIRAAERSHEMQMVDRWVINSVFTWISENQEKVEASDGFSINLSSNSLSDDSVLAFVLAQFSETMVAPSKIIFEFPESAASANVSVTADFVTTLKSYGCRFAIDDFGMADASFSYLNSLPVDFVKIDGKLVVDILASSKDLAVVRSINEIGHLLGKQTIAEFVENDEILARIRELGVDYAQGFGIEKPMLLESL